MRCQKGGHMKRRRKVSSKLTNQPYQKRNTTRPSSTSSSHMLLCRPPQLSHIPSYHTLFTIADDEQAAELTKLLESTRGHVEKLNDGNPLKLGSWHILWWQPRWYHAEHDCFCHQPISTTEATLASGYFSLARPRSKPVGKVVKIPYCSIERIEVRASPSGSRTEFLLVCTDGKTHTFKCKTTEACERLVGNLRELRTLANR